METRRLFRVTLKTREAVTVEQELTERKKQPRIGKLRTPSYTGDVVIKLASEPSTSHVCRDLLGGRLTTEIHQ